MNNIEFKAALRDLEQGRIPANMDEVIRYAEDTVLETRQLVSSLTECAKRQEKSLQLLRAWYDGQLRKAQQQQRPQWVGPSAELIPDAGEG